jgi:hypothetical protein
MVSSTDFAFRHGVSSIVRMRKALIALVLGLVSTSGYAVPDQGSATADQQAVARCELSNGVKMVLDYSALTKGRANPEGVPMDFVTSANWMRRIV